MLSFSHTLTSLPFAFYLQNPLLIFLAAFIMHVFADTLLHWNIYPNRFKRYPYILVGLDVLGGLIAAWVVTGTTFFSLPVLAAIAGGNAADVAHAFWDMQGSHNKERYPRWIRAWFTFHERAQWETLSVIKGLLSQVVVVIIALSLLP